LRSKALEACLEEAREGLERGYERFQLLGEDTGAWGLDIGSDFVTLLDRLAELSPPLRLKFEDYRPLWLVRQIDALERRAGAGSIYWITVPIQSGSPAVLRDMHRFSDTGEILEALRRLRRASADLALVTNVMVGFPTEAADDFERTLDLLLAVRFDAARFVPFSARPGTPAWHMPPLPSPGAIELRLELAGERFGEAGYQVSRSGSEVHVTLAD
jgi:tRNA A37 methylthiotransferase MiaB